MALLFLAGKLVINRGELAEADLAAVHQAGLSDTEVIEGIGLLVLAALALVISWVLALRAFDWLLRRLGG